MSIFPSVIWLRTAPYIAPLTYMAPRPEQSFKSTNVHPVFFFNNRHYNFAIGRCLMYESYESIQMEFSQRWFMELELIQFIALTVTRKHIHHVHCKSSDRYLWPTDNQLLSQFVQGSLLCPSSCRFFGFVGYDRRRFVPLYKAIHCTLNL